MALRLESLLYRDGLTFEEASGVLQTDFGVTESREALYDLSQKLPFRSNRRDSSGHEPAKSGSRSSPMEQAERQDLARRTFLVLRRALARLPARDRIILRLHFEDGMSVADVAKSLGEEQKARIERGMRSLKQLRADLELEGIRCGDAQELLSTLDWESALAADGNGSGSWQEEGR